MGQPISKDDLDPEVVEYIDGLETEVTDLTKSVEDLTVEKDAAEKERDEAKDALAKAEQDGLIVKSEEDIRKEALAKADPAVRMLIEKQEAELAEVRKAAEAERDARLTREFVSKAETLPMLSENKDDLGGLLRRMADALSPEDNAAVEKMLSAANAQIAKGNLFEEFGRGGGTTTISKSVEAAAEEVRKAHPDWTPEQAVAHVYETNPGLLAEAMQEG